MAEEHNRRILREFGRQAATFTDTGFANDGLRWIVGLLAPVARDRVLDVAAGAAHLGRALAPAVAHVCALDLTPEMITQGRRLAAGDGLRNIAFVRGDATALPWPDATFDLVVCRWTLHQVADPATVVREMARVTRPDGRLGIIDIVLVDDAVEADNTYLERLRDPSHHRTLSPGQIDRLVRLAGAEPGPLSVRDNPVDLQDWLGRTDTPPAARAEIHERLAAELAGGPPTGLRPTRERGVLGFTHRWGCIVARRAGQPG